MERVPDVETAVTRVREAARGGRPYGLILVAEPPDATGPALLADTLVARVQEARDTLPPLVLLTLATRRVVSAEWRAAGWSGTLVKPVRHLHLNNVLELSSVARLRLGATGTRRRRQTRRPQWSRGCVCCSPKTTWSIRSSRV